jgi:phosphate transport system ATP-binding protein
MASEDKIIVREVRFSYGDRLILKQINATLRSNTITAIRGSSGQGKTTFLGLFNRMWDGIPHARMHGSVRVRIGENWVEPSAANISLPMLRRKVAMIFQEPNPLPMSIGRNMAFPLKLAGIRDKAVIRERSETSLKQAFLWDEVRDRLTDSALDLSGGQKQRLCVARALMLEPEILLCDEPTSSLDATAAEVIEDLLTNLKKKCTILVVSHSNEQVRRLADRVMILENGQLVEG